MKEITSNKKNFLYNISINFIYKTIWYQYIFKPDFSAMKTNSVFLIYWQKNIWHNRWNPFFFYNDLTQFSFLCTFLSTVYIFFSTLFLEKSLLRETCCIGYAKVNYWKLLGIRRWTSWLFVNDTACRYIIL